MRNFGFCLAFLLVLLFAMPGLAECAGSVFGTIRSYDANGGLAVMKDPEGKSSVGFQWNTDGQGSLPESLVKVQLIACDIDMARMPDQAVMDWYQEGKPPAGYRIFMADTDENGDYRIEDVPAGEYFLVTVMPGGGRKTSYAKDLRELEEYLPNWGLFELAVIGIMGRCDARRVTVKEDGRIRADYVLGSRFPLHVTEETAAPGPEQGGQGEA